MTRDELIARLKGYEWTDFECKKARADVPKDAYSSLVPLLIHKAAG